MFELVYMFGQITTIYYDMVCRVIFFRTILHFRFPHCIQYKQKENWDDNNFSLIQWGFTLISCCCRKCEIYLEFKLPPLDVYFNLRLCKLHSQAIEANLQKYNAMETCTYLCRQVHILYTHSVSILRSSIWFFFVANQDTILKCWAPAWIGHLQTTDYCMPMVIVPSSRDESSIHIHEYSKTPQFSTLHPPLSILHSWFLHLETWMSRISQR